MDTEEANKFINSLVKNLQVLCHGHVSFNSSIQVIGHLYLNVDSNTNIDYIVNEKVCKNDTSSTVFVSNSYHSDPPKKKADKAAEKEQEHTGTNNSTQRVNDRLRLPEPEKFTAHPMPNRNYSDGSFSSRKRRKQENQFIIHSPKVFKNTSELPLPISPLRQGAQNYSEHATRDSHSTPSIGSVTANNDNDPPDTKPFQVIPPVDIDISNIKSEPAEHPPDEVIDDSYIEQSASNLDSSNTSIDPMDELSNDEFLIGLRDKTLGLYPIQMHQSEYGNSSQSFPQPSYSHDSMAGSSSASNYNTKNSPMSAWKLKNVSKSVRTKCAKCTYCGIIHTNVLQHIKEKHLSLRFQCQKCALTFTRNTSLIRHMTKSCKAVSELDNQSGTINTVQSVNMSGSFP